MMDLHVFSPSCRGTSALAGGDTRHQPKLTRLQSPESLVTTLQADTATGADSKDPARSASPWRLSSWTRTMIPKVERLCKRAIQDWSQGIEAVSQPPATGAWKARWRISGCWRRSRARPGTQASSRIWSILFRPQQCARTARPPALTDCQGRWRRRSTVLYIVGTLSDHAYGVHGTSFQSILMSARSTKRLHGKEDCSGQPSSEKNQRNPGHICPEHPEGRP